MTSPSQVLEHKSHKFKQEIEVGIKVYLQFFKEQLKCLTFVLMHLFFFFLVFLEQL